jgi:hypothetical protein
MQLTLQRVQNIFFFDPKKILAQRKIFANKRFKKSLFNKQGCCFCHKPIAKACMGCSVCKLVFHPQVRTRKSQAKSCETTAQDEPQQRKGLGDIAINWQADLINVWSRDVKDLPVHTDVPRIASKLTISKDGKPMTLAPSDDKFVLVEQILFTLNLAIVGDVHAAEEFRQENRNSLILDPQAECARYLERIITSPRMNPKVLNILKLCHQKIIFPAYYYIKYCLGEEIEIRDNRNSWRVNIDVQSSGVVTVKHTKGQRSAGYATELGDPMFEFDWELGFMTNSNVTFLEKIWVRLVDPPRFHPAASSEYRSEILRSLQTHQLIGLSMENKEKLTAIVDDIYDSVIMQTRSRMSSDDDKRSLLK